MWFATIFVTLFVLFFLLGVGLLAVFIVSMIQGIHEMGNCKNSNCLGLDVSYSEQHGDHHYHST